MSSSFWRRHPEVRPPLRFDGGSVPDSTVPVARGASPMKEECPQRENAPFWVLLRWRRHPESDRG